MSKPPFYIMAKKKIKVPMQKTFSANNSEALDDTVNEWLKQRHIDGKSMPMHGKSYSSSTEAFCEHNSVYYFIEEIEIDESIKGD